MLPVEEDSQAESLCVCWYVHMCMQCVQQVHTHMEARGGCWVKYLIISLPYFPEAGSLTELELTVFQSVWLGALVIFVSSSLSVGVTGTHSHAHAGLYALCPKHSYPQSHLPCPTMIFFLEIPSSPFQLPGAGIPTASSLPTMLPGNSDVKETLNLKQRWRRDT